MLISEREKNGCPSPKGKENKFVFSLTFFFFYLGLHLIEWCRFTLLRQIFLTPCTDWNVNLFMKHSIDTTRSSVLIYIWASLSLLMLRHKCNHHTGSYGSYVIFFFLITILVFKFIASFYIKCTRVPIFLHPWQHISFLF